MPPRALLALLLAAGPSQAQLPASGRPAPRPLLPEAAGAAVTDLSSDVPFDAQAQPIPESDLVLLREEGYRLEGGNLYARGSRIPVPDGDYFFLIEELRSAKRLKALLELNLIFSRNNFQDRLSPQDREAVRKLGQENWDLLPEAVRRQIRPYYSDWEAADLQRRRPRLPPPAAPIAETHLSMSRLPAGVPAPIDEPLRTAGGQIMPLRADQAPTVTAAPPDSAVVPGAALRRSAAPRTPPRGVRSVGAAGGSTGGAPPVSAPVPAPPESVPPPPPDRLPLSPLLPPPRPPTKVPFAGKAPLAAPAPPVIRPAAPPAAPEPLPEEEALESLAAGAGPSALGREFMVAALAAPTPATALPLAVEPEAYAAAAPLPEEPPAPKPVPQEVAPADYPKYDEKRFHLFLGKAPYGKGEKALLEALARHAREPERSLALGLVESLLPHIVLDSGQAGRGRRFSLSDLDGGRRRVALNEAPVLVEKTRWVGRGEAWLLPDDPAYYRELGLPRPGTAAFSREQAAAGTKDGELGSVRTYPDGSARLSLSPEELAGDLLAALLALDARERGLDADPYRSALRSESARCGFYAGQEKDLGRPPALSRLTAAECEEWRERPEAFADRIFAGTMVRSYGHELVALQASGAAGVSDARAAALRPGRDPDASLPEVRSAAWEEWLAVERRLREAKP